MPPNVPIWLQVVDSNYSIQVKRVLPNIALFLFELQGEGAGPFPSLIRAHSDKLPVPVLHVDSAVVSRFDFERWRKRTGSEGTTTPVSPVHSR